MKARPRLLACLAAILSIALGGCHPTLRPLHHGCFNPIAEKSARILTRKNPQLRWAAAHRGDRQAGPDNSLPAILSAARHSMPLIEVDVRSSSDRELFLFHDRRISAANTAAPGKLAGRELQAIPAEDLRRLKLPGSSGERIVSYREALAAIRNFASALLLDVKGASPALATQIIQTAQAAGARDSIVIQCQSALVAEFIRSKFPSVPILVRTTSPAEVNMALALRPPPEIIQVDADWMSRRLINEIHEAGSHVLVKTLDQESDTPQIWLELIDAGVDIVLTDHPRAFSRSIPRACEAR